MTTYNSITIRHNTDEILDAFNKLLARSDNLAPVMKDIEGVLAEATERAFDEESSPDHDPWPTLGAFTQSQRQEQGKWPGQILQCSGRLASNIETDSDSDSAYIGTNVIYAAIHQYGGITSPNSMIPNKAIPARPFIGLGPEDEGDILDLLRSFLSEAF